MFTNDEMAELRRTLAALEHRDAHPEEGPYYLHEAVENEALLIRFLRDKLGDPSGPVDVEDVHVPVELDADDLAQAITDWLTKRGVHGVPGPGENATAIIEMVVTAGAFECARVVGYARPVGAS